MQLYNDSMEKLKIASLSLVIMSNLCKIGKKCH